MWDIKRRRLRWPVDDCFARCTATGLAIALERAVVPPAITGASASPRTQQSPAGAGRLRRSEDPPADPQDTDVAGRAIASVGHRATPSPRRQSRGSSDRARLRRDRFQAAPPAGRVIATACERSRRSFARIDPWRSKGRRKMDAVACKSAASALTEATVSRRFAASSLLVRTTTSRIASRPVLPRRCRRCHDPIGPGTAMPLCLLAAADLASRRVGRSRRSSVPRRRRPCQIRRWCRCVLGRARGWGFLVKRRFDESISASRSRRAGSVESGTRCDATPSGTLDPTKRRRRVGIARTV